MRLLLHICCGPCAIYPIKKLVGTVNDRPLLGKKFDNVTGFFYNPNIHPPSEYKKRRDTLRALEKDMNIKVIYPEYIMEEYFNNITLDAGAAARCESCWEARLLYTARFAKREGFEAFTTTLLISPYQDHEIIKKIGESISDKEDIEFYYKDLRKGFKESQEEAKKRDLYRQKYCGCVFSELERAKI
ncbi:MAG: epoxyqueuosine reductase QueH [Candidatus Omnitrophota bacterium]